MAKPARHAASDSLLGQLQRGRGEGFIRILSVPKEQASQLLVECISNDPRLDSQVEERSKYYASIAIAVELDLAPLAEHLRDHDDVGQSTWNTSLAVDTLGELAKRRYKDAEKILFDYVAWGQWWDGALDRLFEIPDFNLHQDVARAIERHFPTDNGLEEAVSWALFDEGSWAKLAKVSARIGKCKISLRAKSRESARDLTEQTFTSFTTPQLLEIANRENSHILRKVIIQRVEASDVDFLLANVSVEKPFVSNVALTGLAKLAPVKIFQWLLNFYLSNPKMPRLMFISIIEIMVAFPTALTLPIARKWLFSVRADERFMAEELFEAHAITDDISIMKKAINLALHDDEENCFRLFNLATAFSHFPNIGVVQELVDVFIRFRYSRGRGRAGEAINVTAPDFFREKFATECLWDCESDSRELGAKLAANDSTNVFDRFEELASDIWEDESVRSEAGKRIAGDEES